MIGENRIWNHPILYVALGNSLTVGVGANYSPGFVLRYQRFAEASLNRQIFVRIFARSGATTGDILQIIQSPQVGYTVRQASILTIDAGGDDLIQAARVYLENRDKRIFEQALNQARENISSIMEEVKRLKSDSQTAYIIRVLDLYNPLPKEAIVDKWIRLFNRHLRNCCAHDNIAVTDLYTAFKGREASLLATDGVHPNPEGYQVIAEELNRLGYAPLH